MKRILASALSAALLLTMLAGCGGNNNSSNNGSSNTGTSSASNTSSGDKVVKIGVFEPQSGDNGAGGKQEILGMQYAHSLTPTVEIGGETYTVELVYADNQSANDKAPSAAQTLVSAGCSVVLGSYGSGVSIAASDTFGDAGVPAIGVTCTNPRSPLATTTTSASASSIPSRAQSWLTSPRTSFPPPRLTAWPSRGTTTPWVCATTS